MPVKGGHELLRELRHLPQTAGIPILVVSMMDEEQSVLAQGATEYLTKPLKKDVLLRALDCHVPRPVAAARPL